jgi:hypothetical protein
MARIWGPNGSGLALNATDMNAIEADLAVALAGVGAPGGAIDGGNATSSYTTVGTIDGGNANG